MATAISSNSSPYLMILLCFLWLAGNVKSFSFYLPKFEAESDTNPITLEGDASLSSNGSLQLAKLVNGVPQPNSAGRASYTAPVRLWNAKTGELAAFTTSFSFIVEPTRPGVFGDGISFFIAPSPSKIPRNSSGGFLGLFPAHSAFNAYQNQLVAIEFDSFSNSWDPTYRHVGININSVVSAATAKWSSGNIYTASAANAVITYEPVSKNLSVIVRYPLNGATSGVSFVVDLRTVLPQWVQIGFSGATGKLVELHKIFSWAFASSF